MAHHLGKRPARPYTSDHTPMAELLRAVPSGSIPPIPANFGHGYDFGATGWGMMGNGLCDDGSITDTSLYAYGGGGDCVWAKFSHGFMESARNAGRPIPKFTCASTLNNYCAYLGIGSYENLNASNDQGSDMQEALKRAQTQGYTDAGGNVYKIGKTVSGTPGNLQELWAIAYLFELADIGVNLQQAQENAFPGPWTYVAGSPTIGGHCVPVMGNNGLITWADRVGFTQSFFEQLCDEFYGYIDPLRYNRVTGETLEDYTDADLEKYVVLVAQQKAAR
ncbi:MAG: hypothetical protein JO130_18465 [Solirubrobacterales bacterium]|nr:hypothetical protein [Solirubrobacterales bacterium]